MKKILLTILPVIVIALIGGCSKKKSSTAASSGNNNNTNTNTSPYYFRFTLNGSTDTLVAGDSKTYSQNTNAILGAVTPGTYSLTPSISLMFSLPEWWDTVTEAQVLGLAGKTFHFTDTIMGPQMEYQPNDTDTWYSDPLADTSYNVKVATVAFLDSDNYQGYPVRLYVVSGTCIAPMRLAGSNDHPLTGSFNMIIARVIYN